MLFAGGAGGGVAELELILVLLAFAAALQVVARRFGIPQPALLVLGGAALALLPGLPRPSLDPELIFLIFVPPLLYYAAIRAPQRELAQKLWPIFHLSVPLVLFTMLAVAVVVHGIDPEFTWPAAFVLGAIVAPPDPVAAVAVMRPLRTPTEVTAILEGEGMFNDATALVAYRLAVATAVTGVFSLGQAAADFAWSGPLGVAAGLILGRAVLGLRARLQYFPLVDNSVSLLTPFVVYLTADALGASGVLAVVAAGLYIGQRLSTVLSPAARVQTTSTWGLLAFILENLVFILIGLELPYVMQDAGYSSVSDWLGLAAVVSLVVILVRLAVVLPGPFLWRGLTRQARPDLRGVALVGWMGVRGAESVVIALALPQLTAAGTPFPARGDIVFISFAVVFATLVLQGMTIGPFARRLGLQGDTRSEQEEAHARHVLASTGLERLDELAGSNGNSAEIVDELRYRHQHRARRWEARERRLGRDPIGRHPADSTDDDGDAGGEAHAASYRQLRSAMLDAERDAVVKLRDEGIIGGEVLRRIERDLDLEGMLLDEGTLDGSQRG